MWEDLDHCGWCHPGLAVLVSLRKQAEQAWGSSSLSVPLHRLCISCCLHVPALCEFLSWLSSVTDWGCGSISQINYFLFKLLLVTALYHSHRNSKTHILNCVCITWSCYMIFHICVHIWFDNDLVMHCWEYLYHGSSGILKFFFGFESVCAVVFAGGWGHYLVTWL
jgi:hypothetical protein